MNALQACQGHPNIVTMHELLRDDQYTYLVMELLTGGELFDRIRLCRKFTEKEAIIFFEQIVRAVHHMHLKQVAHRDLKAENIIFTSPDATSLKIVDFGFAKQDFNSGMTTPCFTLDYAAPEVLPQQHHQASSRQRYTEASDLWSLGVILYTMLCGQTPFVAPPKMVNPEERIKSIMARIRLGAIEVNINEWRNVSEAGKHLVRGLLNVDTEQRLTMAQLLNHEWFNQRRAGKELPAMVQSKGDMQCCISDTCQAYQNCLTDQFSGKPTAQKRRRRSSSLERNDKQKRRKESDADPEDDDVGRSKSSSGIVTSDFNRSLSVDTNSSDVEIVAEYKNEGETEPLECSNRRTTFKMGKAILGSDALVHISDDSRDPSNVAIDVPGPVSVPINAIAAQEDEEAKKLEKVAEEEVEGERKSSESKCKGFSQDQYCNAEFRLYQGLSVYEIRMLQNCRGFTAAEVELDQARCDLYRDVLLSVGGDDVIVTIDNNISPVEPVAAHNNTSNGHAQHTSYKKYPISSRSLEEKPVTDLRQMVGQNKRDASSSRKNPCYNGTTTSTKSVAAKKSSSNKKPKTIPAEVESTYCTRSTRSGRFQQRRCEIDSDRGVFFEPKMPATRATKATGTTTAKAGGRRGTAKRKR